MLSSCYACMSCLRIEGVATSVHWLKLVRNHSSNRGPTVEAAADNKVAAVAGSAVRAI